MDFLSFSVVERLCLAVSSSVVLGSSCIFCRFLCLWFVLLFR